MAIYHFTCKYVSRAGKENKNAVRSAAYCAGEELIDLKSGTTFNYSNKSEVVFSEIQAPANAPEWVVDRQRLWSEVEKKEIRYDAKLMSQFEASLPHELNLEQSKALMYEFASVSFVKRGMISDWSIHWLQHNRHVHINATTREISGQGFGNKVREWEEKKTLYALRKEWADCVNKHLAMAGFDVRIDHRSFKDQGIDHEPTVHVGPERANNKEIVSERKARNRRTRSRNRLVDAAQKADVTIKQLESSIQINEGMLVKAVLRECNDSDTRLKLIKKKMLNSLEKSIAPVNEKQVQIANHGKASVNNINVVKANSGLRNKIASSVVRPQPSACRGMAVYQKPKYDVYKNFPRTPRNQQACFAIRTLFGENADYEIDDRAKVRNLIGMKYSWRRFSFDISRLRDDVQGANIAWWREFARDIYAKHLNSMSEIRKSVPEKYLEHFDDVIKQELLKANPIPAQPAYAVTKFVRQVKEVKPDEEITNVSQPSEESEASYWEAPEVTHVTLKPFNPYPDPWKPPKPPNGSGYDI